MTSLSPQHFDSPRPPSTLGAALRLVADRWATCGALVLLAALLLCAGALVAVTAAAVRDWSDAALRAAPLVVVLDAQATAADAEATGALLRSIPGVVDAVFRSRDDALKDLVARGLPPPDGRNPLPDTWTLHLRPDAGGAGPAERVAATRRAVDALPHVAASRVDPRWIADLDRAETLRRRLQAPLVVGALVLTGIAALCAGLLAGGSLTANRDAVTKWSLTVIALFALLAATALAAGVLFFGGTAIVARLGGTQPVDIDALLGSAGKLGASACFVVAVMLLAGVIAAHRADSDELYFRKSANP